MCIMVVYTCARCGYSTKYSTSYRAHLSRMYTCDDIKRSGKSMEDLLKQFDRRKDENSYCPDCGCNFTSRSQKSYHLNGHCPMKTQAPPSSSSSQGCSTVTNNATTINNVTINTITNNNNGSTASDANEDSTTCGGWIYAVTCPMYEANGYIKLGMTRGCADESGTRRALVSRYGTTLIDPKVIAVMRTEDRTESEQILFSKLAEYRLKTQREIFVFDDMQVAIGDVVLPALWHASQASSSKAVHDSQV